MSEPALKKKTVLSAVQPTNQLHLGNYLGAIRNWIPYQEEYECLFFAVDLHSITAGAAKNGGNSLRENTYRAIATYIACGIDPNKSILFAQSQVPAHTELAWVLTCHSSMGELSRMTQFKDKSAKHEHIPTGLFVYPVLMAADILLYDTHLVPVGEDQKQHLELARDLALRMNNAYPSTLEFASQAKRADDPHPLFVVPAPLILKEGARIMSLQNADSKMSKSDPTPGACVFLTDSDKEIEKKFKRAVTDSGSEVSADSQSAGVRNLLQIQSSIRGEDYPSALARFAGKQYGVLKLDTANIVIETVRPIRERTEEILKDREYLSSVLKAGSERARARAEKVLNEVYKRVGFIRE